MHVGAQRLPDVGGSGIPSSRDALPRKTLRPARQSRSSKLEPRRFDRLQARRATSMRIAYSRTPAVSLMSKVSSSRCTSFAAIAFGTPAL